MGGGRSLRILARGSGKLKTTFLVYDGLNQKSGGYLYDRKLKKYLEEIGENVEVISIPRKDYLQNIGDNFKSDIIDRFLSLDTDLLLQDELVHPSLFHLNKRLNKSTDYPIVSIVHNLSYLAERNHKRRKMYRTFEENYLKTVDGFIFNSRSTKRSVRSLVGEVDGVVAYPGKDHVKPPSDFPKKFEIECFDILFVGNLLPNKGLDILIKALEGAENFQLRVAGSTDTNRIYTERIEKMIEEKGLSSQIDLIGFVSKDDLSELFKKSDILVVPSFYEGFGIVYLEALGYGLPIIGSTRGGAGEIISDGEEGFLLHPGKVEDLRNCLDKVRNKPEILKEMSVKARKRFEELPSWRKSMEKVVEYLKSAFISPHR